LRKDWRRYAAAAIVAAVLAAGWYAVGQWRAGRAVPAAVAARDVRAFVLPQRAEVIGEAEEILAALGKAADQPGEAWIVHTRLLGSDVQFWLDQERLSSDDEAFRSRVGRQELALELLANLRLERADAEAKVLAAALRGGPEALADQLAGRYKEALEKYEKQASGFRPQASGTATTTKETTASPSSAGGFISNNSNGDLSADEVAFLTAACRQGQGDAVRAVEGYEAVAPAKTNKEPSRFAAEAMVRAGEVCEMGLDSPVRARGYYERAVNEFPHQEPAARAMYAIGRTYEEEGRVEEALGAYAALGEATWAERRVRDAALGRADFLRSAASSDEATLKAFLSAERLARQPRNRTAALLELIRLPTLHPESAVAGEALATMVRIQLALASDAAKELVRQQELMKEKRAAQSDLDKAEADAKTTAAAARLTFDRLSQSHPPRLSGRAARSLASSAAEWLVQDVDRDLASSSAVFSELAGYAAEANVSGPENGGAGDWRIVFKSSAGPRGQGRDLEFALTVGGASKVRSATYPNLGLAVKLEIKTANEVLTAELRRVIGEASQAAGRLDRAAAQRLPDGAVKP
jgi:tetratricopeptide (TPR) repeat protein